MGVSVEEEDDAATPLVGVPVEDENDDAAVVGSCSDARVLFVFFTCRVADIDTGVAAAAPDDVVALLE